MSVSGENPGTWERQYIRRLDGRSEI